MKTTQRMLIVGLAAALLAGAGALVRAAEPAAQPAAAAPPPAADDKDSRVTLTWDKFKQITGWDDARKPEEAGVFTLSWKEVEDLLGVKVKDMANAKIRIPWQEFKALLVWSIEQKKKPEAGPPPSDYAITRADYVGVLSKDGAVFTATFEVSVLKEEGWKTIPLLPVTVAIQSITLPKGAYLRLGQGHYEVLTAAAGDLKIEAKFATAVTEQGGSYRAEFQRVPAATSIVDLQVAQAGVDIQVAGAQSVVKKEEGGATRVLAALAAPAPVRVSWERAVPEVEKVPPKLYAETQTLIAVGDGILVGRENVRYNILHTGVRVLKLTLPPGVSILDVRGERLRDWRVAEKELSVALSSEALGDYSLTITYEAALPADQAAAAPIPVIRAAEVVREKGHIGVVALANVELSAPEIKGATAIDVRELPPELLSMTGQPVLLAYRYVADTFDIPLAIKKHADVKVLVTIVDSAVVTTMQTLDGRRITKVVYNVRNNRQQFLRLAMPGGGKAGDGKVEIWSASVSGRSIRPARDEQGNVLIPLVRSEGASSGLASFPVEIVYVEKEDKAPEPAGTLRIDLPRASEPVTHLMVNLYLPKEGTYKKGWSDKPAIESPLTIVKEFRRLLGGMDEQVMDAEVAANALQQAAQVQADTVAAGAGATPIRVNLPIDGQLFRLEKILVLDEPLFVEVKYSGWEKR